MEDFDYIDSLAKKALSDRTAEPSADGWNMVQQKMKRKKRKRLIIYIVFFGLLCSLGIYVGVNSEATIDTNAVSSKNTKQVNSNNNKNTQTKVSSTSNSVSSSTSSSNSTSKVNDASQAGTNTSVVQSESQTKNQHQTANNVHGEKSGILQTQAGVNSQLNTVKRNVSANASNVSTKPNNENPIGNETDMTFTDGEEEAFYLSAAGLKIYPWELITPETLKKKRKKKKKKKSKKVKDVYENLDLMVGFNGFVTPNDYNFIGSYVFELSYTKEEKLKNNYEFNYGAALQFRNLRFNNDSLSFNRGELSLNILSSLEKRFGDFGIEAGGYAGYELYSPNNDFFTKKDINLFDRKINYGLFSILHYKKVGLVFKYEFSPYINYVGDKKFGAFTIGVKYDF